MIEMEYVFKLDLDAIVEKSQQLAKDSRFLYDSASNIFAIMDKYKIGGFDMQNKLIFVLNELQNQLRKTPEMKNLVLETNELLLPTRTLQASA